MAKRKKGIGQNSGEAGLEIMLAGRRKERRISPKSKEDHDSSRNDNVKYC
jgi:hypothetical protein